MAELDNAKRSLPRATFTPITPTRREAAKPKTRAWDKWSFAAGLKVRADETERVIKRMGARGASARAVSKIARLVTTEDNEPASLALERAQEFTTIDAQLLLRFGQTLIEVRKAAVADSLKNLRQLEAAHSKAAAPSAPAEVPVITKPPRGFTHLPEVTIPTALDARVFARTSSRILPAAARRAARSVEVNPATDTIGREETHEAMLIRPAPPVVMRSVRSTSPLTVESLLAWAAGQPALREQTKGPKALMAKVGARTSMTTPQLTAGAIAWANATADIVAFFQSVIGVEPVGLLHLERLSFIPAGIERGELVYSVPLSPNEEVNISHKEWSNTSEEFERIVTDFIEAYSEEGVTEKSELSHSTSSQQQHSSNLNLGVTASGGYGPVTISTTVGFSVADSASNSQQMSRNQSSELTRKASSRTKKEHKVSFKVASASGTEDQAIRKIVNPLPQATRLDYYQLIRKWRVDLHRYGVRLTYDLTIPEPGSDILAKLQEIQGLQAAVQQGFNAPDSTLPWARFDLHPNDVRRDNYEDLAAEYGSVVEPPPPASYSIIRQFTRNWPNKDASNDSDYSTFTIEVPDAYEVTSIGWSWVRWAWEDEDEHFTVHPDFNSWLGRWGSLSLAIGTKFVSAFVIDVTLGLTLRSVAFDAWQMRVWGALRDAAQARYELNRTMLKNQLAQLLEALGSQDALSLRKVEREEVMKGVLRWLFGPSFTFVPPGLPSGLYGPSESVISNLVWAKVMAQGEVIKFLHHAIEWENMLYFLYPYFWSHTSRWEFKKYLDHPDFMHRSFLKAGAARVVLTIRPGFERDFVSFVETGSFSGLPAGHPYLTIAEEMQAFAKTNYPGIRPANPTESSRPLLSPKQKRAWRDMEGIIAQLEQHRILNGAYPTTAQGLAALAVAVPAADPWGRPYVYRSPGLLTDFELESLGADGIPGGKGDDSDITNWAEASLIGQWYDYTPTSALDIAFNETMPTA